MDTYAEQIVAIRKSPMERLLQVSVIVLGVILILACGMLYVGKLLGVFSLLFVVLAVGIGYGIYCFASQLNLEYEYIFTNGDFDVDKIISKRSRKRVLSGQCRLISEFGRYDPDLFAARRFDSRVVACTVDRDACYAVFSLDEGREALLIFSPNERMLNAMKKYAPRVIRLDPSGN